MLPVCNDCRIASDNHILLRRPMKSLANLRILIIEDDLRMVELLRTGLWEMGHSIVSATTAEEGQKLVDENRFDAIVLDIGLPGRSGYTIAQHLRERTNRPAIVMLTALDQEDYIVCGLDAGADDCLYQALFFSRVGCTHRLRCTTSP